MATYVSSSPNVVSDDDRRHYETAGVMLEPEESPEQSIEEPISQAAPAADTRPLDYRTSRELPDRDQRLLLSAGYVDQAALTLFQVFRLFNAPNLYRAPQAPRSALLELARIYQGFRFNRRFMSQLSLVGSAMGLASSLVSDWRHLSRDKTESRAYRTYRIASLAAATLVIPWVLLRR